ncbi:MAG: archaellin/type IV pilin N-terminal domain-containing protein [Nitrososphaerota archaeon]
MKSRRAVSPILAVIILVGIAVVGGGLLSSAQNQFLNTAFSEIEYKVTDLRLEKSGNSCYFVAKLYNSGTIPINTTRINATLDSGEPWSPTSPALGSMISPSQTLPVFEQFSGNACGNFTSSHTYSIGVEARSETSSHKTVIPVKVRDVIR